MGKLKQAFKQVIESSRKRIDFKSIGYLPRWAILCFDSIILVLSLFVTKLIVSNVQKTILLDISFTKQEVILLVVNILFFILFRTYAGLIRHSTFIDAAKFIVATLATLASLVIIHYSYYFFVEEEIFFIPKLLIYSVISFCGLFLFRVLVKQVFEVYQRYNDYEARLNVLVYGTGENAIAIATALKSEKPARYNVLGFIDRDGRNKKIEMVFKK